jgi:hypothetical protein
MAIWFSCKIKYQKQEESGKVTNMSEQFLVDAMSFTEAEARLYFELGSTIREFTLTNISKMTLHDLFHYEDSEIWFKCKVVYVSVDEKSGKEKKVTNTMLVSANNAKQAYDRVEESLSTMLVPFEITDVNQTAIVEIFPYIEEEERPAGNFKPLAKSAISVAGAAVDPETGELLEDAFAATKAPVKSSDDVERIYDNEDDLGIEPTEDDLLLEEEFIKNLKEEDYTISAADLDEVEEDEFKDEFSEEGYDEEDYNAFENTGNEEELY